MSVGNGVASTALVRLPDDERARNVKRLELLLTRHLDVELFDGARLEFLVFDEVVFERPRLGGAGTGPRICLRDAAGP